MFLKWTGGAEALVAVDPGHGGYDKGIVYNASGKEISEKNVALALARAITAALQAKGAGAFTVRPIDRYLGISERAQIAEARHPALFLSIHLSSADSFKIYVSLMPDLRVPPAGIANQGAGSAPVPGTGQNGDAAPGIDADRLRQFYLHSMVQRPWLDQSRALASKLEDSLKQAYPEKNISYLEIPLPLLDAIAAPAVLIECPGPQYMNYNDPAVVSGMAQAVANAVITYGKY